MTSGIDRHRAALDEVNRAAAVDDVGVRGDPDGRAVDEGPLSISCTNRGRLARPPARQAESWKMRGLFVIEPDVRRPDSARTPSREGGAAEGPSRVPFSRSPQAEAASVSRWGRRACQRRPLPRGVEIDPRRRRRVPGRAGPGTSGRPAAETSARFGQRELETEIGGGPGREFAIGIQFDCSFGDAEIVVDRPFPRAPDAGDPGLAVRLSTGIIVRLRSSSDGAVEGKPEAAAERQDVAIGDAVSSAPPSSSVGARAE